MTPLMPAPMPSPMTSPPSLPSHRPLRRLLESHRRHCNALVGWCRDRADAPRPALPDTGTPEMVHRGCRASGSHSVARGFPSANRKAACFPSTPAMSESASSQSTSLVPLTPVDLARAHHTR
jgi:hypothetical protein